MSVQASRDARYDGTLVFLEAQIIFTAPVIEHTQCASFLSLCSSGVSASDAEKFVVDCTVARSINIVC